MNAPHILPIVEEELVANTPTTLSEMIRALHRRGIRITEIEMAAALGALIARGKAEILPALRYLRRGARNDARYAAARARGRRTRAQQRLAAILVPSHRGFDGLKFNGGLGGPRA